MAATEEHVTRQLSEPTESLSHKLEKGRRRHTTENLGSVQKLAKGFTFDTGMLSRHESVDFGEKVEVLETEDTENQVSLYYFF